MRRRRTEKTAEQLEHEKDRRAARRNPIFKWISAQESGMKQQIDADVQLTKDFEFLVKETGIAREALLNGLCWDCDMMHADPQTIVSRKKQEMWPIDEQSLRKILRTISAAAKQIEKVNSTTLSPGQADVLLDSSGAPFERRKERSLLIEFARLPEILRIYHSELKRGVDEATELWPRQSARTRHLVEHARENSLYERIRLASPENKYHANRLHRLVNAAREVQGLKGISRRSFIVWLNKTRKRAAHKVAAQGPKANPANEPSK